MADFDFMDERIRTARSNAKSFTSDPRDAVQIAILDELKAIRALLQEMRDMQALTAKVPE